MKKEVKRVVKNSVQSDISKLSTLEFLLSDFSILKRVANYFAKNLADLAGKNHIFNLLLTLPTSASQVIFCPKLFDVGDGALVILKLKIETHIKPENRRQPYKIICYTPTGFVSLVFFKTYPGQMEKLVIGREVAVLGHLSKSIRENQIVHPLEIVDISEIDQLPKVNLVYPLSGALTQKFVRAKIVEILRFLDKRFDEEKAQKNDWIDKNLRSQRGWPLFVPALKMIHNFGFEYDDKAQNNALQRLKYDELLAWQIAMILVRRREEKTKIMPQITSDIADEFLKKLPFDPTKSQLKVAMEIKKNILSNKTMLRLLQGDVGSGKTILAIYACLLAYASGKQSCVIVPISILADQHLEYFKRMVVAIAPHPNPLPTSGEREKNTMNLTPSPHLWGRGSHFTPSLHLWGRGSHFTPSPHLWGEGWGEGRNKIPIIEILTSKTKKLQRKKILNDLRDGKIDILISTHAVLQDDVVFKNLGLVVIDEQHRFGVMQRLKLVEKGNDVDVLLMSATPIPRSLMMSFYGDMDISILDEKPKNRREIETKILSQKRKDEVLEGVKRALKRGEKVYFLCPLIEENEQVGAVHELSLQSAEARYQELCAIFGKEKVSLIHGKMKPSEKEKIMEDFKKPSSIMQILVATTVIEVGVDVPDATIIIIENAENFGLAQLHQLRGRVGRSDKKSYCLLLYGKKYGKIAQERLKIMRESNDGFFIAEEDLKLRGSGELLGTRQSGELGFKIANLETDLDLLKIASKNAQVILNEDVTLIGSHSAKFRALLKLFDYEDCLKIISGG